MFKIRDKETFILFIIGFGLSLFIVMNGYHLMNAWYKQYEKKISSYNYSKSMSFCDTNVRYGEFTKEEYEAYEAQFSVDAAQMIQMLSGREVTTYISKYFTVQGFSDPLLVDVVFSYQDEWFGELQSGRYPEKEDILQGKRYVLIGEDILIDEWVEGSGQTLKVAGDEYEIIGVFKNYSMSGVDDSVVIFYPPGADPEDGFHANIAFFLDIGDVLVTVGSNSGNVEDNYAKLLQDIESSAAFAVLEEDAIPPQETNNKVYFQIKLAVLVAMYLISMINCFYLSRLWAVRKQKDFMIMKIYGMDDKQILTRAFAELASNIGAVFLFVILLDGLYSLIFRQNTYASISVYGLKTVFVAIGCMILFTLIPIRWMIRKTNPAEKIREL